jgi:hypothetical protein
LLIAGGTLAVWITSAVFLVMLTEVSACTPWCAMLVAFTAICLLVLFVGAVNRPVLEIVPELADQLTAVLPVSVSIAENWMCPPGATDGLIGVISSVTHFSQGLTVTRYPCSRNARAGSLTTAILKLKLPA